MSEALTGRKKTFYLFPISYKETVGNSSPIEAKRMLDTRLKKSGKKIIPVALSVFRSLIKEGELIE